MREIRKLLAFKCFCFNRFSRFYKRITAINITDCTGNPIKSQTKYGSELIYFQLLELRWGEKARWLGEGHCACPSERPMITNQKQ